MGAIAPPPWIRRWLLWSQPLGIAEAGSRLINFIVAVTGSYKRCVRRLTTLVHSSGQQVSNLNRSAILSQGKDYLCLLTALLENR